MGNVHTCGPNEALVVSDINKSLDDALDIEMLPVIEMESFCKSDFELYAMRVLSNVSRDVAMKAKVERIDRRQNEIVNYLIDKKVVKLTETTDYSVKYKYNVLLTSIELFLQFDKELTTNKLLKSDLVIQLKEVCDTDFIITKNFNKMLKFLMTKEVASKFTAVRSARNQTEERQLRFIATTLFGIMCGGCCGSMKKRTIVGGYAFTWWFVTDVQRLSLEVMTLNPVCDSVETAQGVPLTVTGVAQCKIMKADELLHTASEQFLGKSVHEIKSTILSTLEGHLRAILGTLSVEEVYKDRDQFAALVREVAAPDVGRMGIEILSFTIKDVYDDVQYLASLGKAQTAAVKRDADVGVAEANRDAGIREAECEKSAMDIKYNTDTKIEDNARLYQLQKANFDQEVNTAKAEAQLAYELQAAKIRQRIRNEEIQIEVVERRKQIEVEEQEVRKKEHELQSTVRLPVEAESYKIGKVSEGKRAQTVEAAKAEAERIKLIGEAEAQALQAIGVADANRMQLKASVYKKYGDAAILNLVLNAMPKIAAEVAAPLARTEEIVLLGGSDVTSGEITRLVGQVPPAVQALTGVDLSKVLGKIPGAK